METKIEGFRSRVNSDFFPMCVRFFSRSMGSTGWGSGMCRARGLGLEDSQGLRLREFMGLRDLWGYWSRRWYKALGYTGFHDL